MKNMTAKRIRDWIDIMIYEGSSESTEGATKT
jgi:hypothetical protein